MKVFYVLLMKEHKTVKKLSVSIAMATYNGIRYIKRQLDSIANQTVKADQVVISDDGSSDGTYEFIEEYIKKNELIRWNLYKNTCEYGISNNFINAIEKCDGDILFLCDQDDIWKKNKIEQIIKIFKKHPDVQCVISKIQYLIDGKISNKNTAFTQNENHYVNLKELLNVCSYLGMSSAFRKKVFIHADREKMISTSHDWILFITALNMGKVFYFGTTCQLYRIHEDNASIIKHKSFHTNRVELIKRKIEHLKGIAEIVYREKNLISEYLEFYTKVLNNLRNRNLLAAILILPIYIKLGFSLRSFIADMAGIVVK